MLPCLHSFCSICLQSFVKSYANRKEGLGASQEGVEGVESTSQVTSFECPTCREKVSVLDLPRGVQSLPTNFWIVSMIDVVNTAESRSENDCGCDICPEDDRDLATSKCQDCSQLFCALHSAAHSKSRDTRHHILVNLFPPSSADSSLNDAQKTEKATNRLTASQIADFQPDIDSSFQGNNFKAQAESSSSSSAFGLVHSIPTRALNRAPSSAPSNPGLIDVQSRRSTPAPQYRCSDHPEEVLKLFCDSCQVPICRDCALVEHRDHTYTFLDKSSEVHRKKLSNALKVTESQIEGIQRLEARINELWNLVRVNSNDMLLSIRELFSEIKASIDRREQDLLVQVETSRQERLMFLHQEKEKLEASRGLLLNAYTSSSEIHDQASDIELLMLQKTLITRLTSLASKVDLKALESGCSKLMLPGSPIGRLVFTSGSSQARNSITSIGKLTVSTESISLGDVKRSHNNGALLKRLYDRLTAPVLRIGVSEPWGNDEDPPAFLEPWGIAVSDKEEIVVVDSSRACIHIESPPANSVTRFISLPSDKHDPIPIGVVFDSLGNIIVTDQANHMVKVLLPTGGCKGLGIEGKENCQFNRPSGIAIETRSDSDGGIWIWVVDSGNRRVQAFTHTLWAHRQTCSQFSEPCAIAVDQKNHRIIVTDTGARLHIVQRGSQDVKVTITIKNYPNYDEDLPAATGIVIDEDGNAVIADTFQNKIFVVRLSDGQIISQIGSNDSFKAPRGLCISPHGKLFITDYHRLQAF